MIQQQDEHRILPDGQDPEQQITDYRHVAKHAYITKIFCWIQSGDTKKTINFFNTFPHLINQFYTPNNWNPLMYAVRYNNMELIEYFIEKGMRTNVNSIFNHISIVHCAVYSCDTKVLHYVLNVLKESPNPLNSQGSPLKSAMKISSTRMVEQLICHGAYYVFADVFNNIELRKQQNDQSNKYISLISGKEVNNSAVVQDSAIKGCQIKEVLRWARIQQIIHLAKSAKLYMGQQQRNNHQFDAMASILSNESHLIGLLKVCIGRGDSILNITDPMQPQKASQK